MGYICDSNYKHGVTKTVLYSINSGQGEETDGALKGFKQRINLRDYVRGEGRYCSVQYTDKGWSSTRHRSQAGSGEAVTILSFEKGRERCGVTRAQGELTPWNKEHRI